MSRDMDDFEEVIPRGKRQAEDLYNIEDTDDFEIVKGPAEDGIKTQKSSAEDEIKTQMSSAEDDFKTQKSPAEDEIKTQKSPAEDGIKTQKSSAEDEIKTQNSPAEDGIKTQNSPAEDNFRAQNSPAEDDFETVTISEEDIFEAVRKPDKSKTYADDEFERLLRKHVSNGGYDADTRSKAERYLDHLYELDDEAYREAEERVSNNPLANEVRARAMKSVEDDKRAQKFRRDEEKRIAREQGRGEKASGKNIGLIILLLLILLLGVICGWLYLFPESAPF